MGSKTITQIVLFIISLVIIFMYIQPQFISIKDTQDELYQYTDALTKAAELNDKLASLLETENSFRQSDLNAIELYLPTVIDEMSIMADIVTIAEASQLHVISLSAEELSVSTDEILLNGEVIKSDDTNSQNFTLTFEGPYVFLKDMLISLEQNHYPLEVVSLEFSAFEDSDTSEPITSGTIGGTYTMILRTYAFTYDSN